MKKNEENSYFLRKATLADVNILVSHHSKMVREIRTKQGKEINELKFKEAEEAQERKLISEIPSEKCHAWVIENKKKIVLASGAISLFSFTASPENPNYIGAYLHSIYTEKDYRGNKFSTRIVNEAISFCRNNSIGGMLLIASDAGLPIYKTLGFETVENVMNIKI